MKGYKVLRSDLTSVWNQPTWLDKLRPEKDKENLSKYYTKYQWKIGLENKTDRVIYACLTIKRALNWAIAALEEYRKPLDLIVVEVECSDIIAAKDYQVSCHSITITKIIMEPKGEYSTWKEQTESIRDIMTELEKHMMLWSSIMIEEGYYDGSSNLFEIFYSEMRK